MRSGRSPDLNPHNIDQIARRYRITKGDRVILPFLAVHHSTDIWGEDALEFK